MGHLRIGLARTASKHLFSVVYPLFAQRLEALYLDVIADY